MRQELSQVAQTVVRNNISSERYLLDRCVYFEQVDEVDEALVLQFVLGKVDELQRVVGVEAEAEGLQANVRQLVLAEVELSEDNSILLEILANLFNDAIREVSLLQIDLLDGLVGE